MSISSISSVLMVFAIIIVCAYVVCYGTKE